MISSNYIYFGIHGDFDPVEVAMAIGLEPTRVARKHSKDNERGLPPYSILGFAQTHAADDQRVVDFYKLAEDVVAELEPYAQQIAEAVKKHKAAATFQVVADFPIDDSVSTPIIGFSARVVRFVADTGASIDIDTYRV